MELILMFLCFTAPFAIVGLWYWFTMMMVISLVVGFTELVCHFATGQTISQRFKYWGRVNRGKAFGVLASLVLGFAALIFHLVKGLW